MNDTLKMAAVAAGALAVCGLLLKKKIDDAGGVGQIAQDVAAGAVGAAGDAASGVVLGVGDVVGIPRTNESECEKAIREGRTWDASFACPAGRFIEYLSSGK